MHSFRQAGALGDKIGWRRLAGLAGLVGLSLVLPAQGQSVRSSWVEPVRATAEVVPMPARFGPLVATMIEASTASPFGSGPVSSGMVLSAPAGSAVPTPSSGTIAVSATPVTEPAPAPATLPGQPVPASDRLDLPPLLEPTGTNGVVQSYLLAAVGDAPVSQAASVLPGAVVGAPVPTHAMIRVHDGHSGRSVVMPSREGVGDGRLMITVVFH